MLADDRLTARAQRLASAHRACPAGLRFPHLLDELPDRLRELNGA
jgi:hypothetical protein